ncbi:MFS transporter [Patescibacteria group bacterium]|nr:MFS transporter [Patescibacteria group bacterium]
MLKSINKVIKILIFSDLVLNSAWGLIGPIFAIFLVQKIAAGSAVEGAKIAGFASLTYWIVKSILQIPIGRYLDEKHGEKDDFWFMVFGTFLAGLVPFGYLIASQSWHIYIFQILYAIGMAMVIPSWSAIFTRHIDKGKEAFEWGLESTSLGFGAGFAGAIGGILVAIFGFKVIFVLVGIFTIISACLLLLIYKEIAPRDKLFPRIPPFRMPF